MTQIAPTDLSAFLKSCEQCEEVQDKILIDILRRAASSRFGQKYGFEKIANYADFASAVPSQSWSTLKPYAEAMVHGESNQLFAGDPDYFVCTSGTTSAIKMMPESAQGRAVKSLTTQLRVEAMLRHASTMMDEKILPLVNNATEGYTEHGVAFGSASGIALATASKAIQDRVAFPIKVLEAGYSDALDYLILRFAVESDVRGVFGNNAGRIEQLFLRAEKEAEQLIDDIDQGTISCKTQIADSLMKVLLEKTSPNPTRAAELRATWKKAGRFLPEAYWPHLQVVACWLAGSVGRYVDALRPLLAPSVSFFDVGYGATEGKFNLPLEPEQPAGPLCLYAAFYEFRAPGKEQFLRAHELQDGEQYELFVTTYSGLYRYAVRDVIRVDGSTGNTPHIVFEYKAGEILNLSGEKVAAASLLPVVAGVTGKELSHWCVVGDAERKRYLFCLEFPTLPDAPQHAAINYAAKLEKALIDQTLIYPIFRNQKLLNSVGVKIMKPGWRAALYADRTREGQSQVQVKLPLVYPEVPHLEYGVAESR
jgi:hypothetical protein